MTSTSVIVQSRSPPSRPDTQRSDQAYSFRLEDDNFGSSDEVKIYQDDDEDKDFSSLEELHAALLEEKSSLILETEQDYLSRSESEKSSSGYPLMSPLPYQPPDEPQGTLRSTTTNSAGSSSSGFPNSPFNDYDIPGNSPPAHIGDLTHSLDTGKESWSSKSCWISGLRTHSIYPSVGHFPSSFLSTVDVSQFSSSDQLPRIEPSTLSGSSSPSLLASHPCKSLRSEGPKNLKLDRGIGDQLSCHPPVYKPLNAFMIYMKEMRPKIVGEGTLKESVAMNQILGRKWHSLSRDEQSKYHEIARNDRQLHLQMDPERSARENYEQSKKRKQKRNKNEPENRIHLKKLHGEFGPSSSLSV